MNAVVTTAPPLGYAEIERLAVSIAKSGLFGVKTPEQALTLMMLAQAEGMHPATAARDYNVIGGRAAKTAEAMMRDFLKGGGRVEWHSLDDTGADATFSHPQGGTARITWDLARAKQAGVGGKENYSKYPRQMFRSRVVSEGVRTVWPVASGGMYAPEEVRDMPPQEPYKGTTLEGTAEREEVKDAAPLRAAAAPMARADRIAEKAPAYATDPLDEPDGGKWLRNLDTLLANAQTQEEVIEIGGHRTVGKATAEAPDAIKRRISELLANAYARFPDDGDAASEDMDEVQIAGAEKLAAGD